MGRARNRRAIKNTVKGRYARGYGWRGSIDPRSIAIGFFRRGVGSLFEAPGRLGATIQNQSVGRITGKGEVAVAP